MSKEVPKEALKLVADVWKDLPEDKRKKLQIYALDAITDLLSMTYGDEAPQEALGIAYDIVNEVGKEGRIVKVRADEAEISFHVPKSVMEAVMHNPELTYEQRVTALKANKWARGWATGLISKMMPGTWAGMTTEEREAAIDRAIEDVLAPRVLA
ncbi:MAG: hypothetical protein ACE5Z5_05725 [Candidatus Bathyarchaeia archaeon]